MPRRGALALPILALSLAAATPAPAGAQSASDPGRPAQGGPAPGLSRAWLNEARDHAATGSWEAAYALAAEAAAMSPADSDIRYFTALAGSRARVPLRATLAELDAALAADSFLDFSARDASLMRAELLVRLRQWSDALRALDGIDGPSRDDAAVSLLRARALAGSGDRSSFLAVLARAMRRFPDDPAFPRLFLERIGRRPYSSEERALADLAVESARRCAPADPELPVLACAVMQDFASRRDAVLAYRAAGGSSAAATSRALEYGLVGEAAAAAEFLGGTYPATEEGLRALHSLAGGPSGRAAILAAFALWSGKLSADRDGDGITEESTTYVRGSPVSWSRDADQDGEPDLDVDFAAGLPVRAALRRAGTELTVVYDPYPSISQLAVAEDSGRRTFAFAPGALSFEALSFEILSETGAVPVRLARPGSDPVPSETACSAAALSVRSERGAESYFVRLDSGRPVSRQGYLGGRLVSELSYSRGAPDRERLDADGDGRFETERTYDAGGNPAFARIDADGDGLYEYFELFSFPFLKEWDFDADGARDARQYSLADGSVRREFSSRLDGAFDESITLKNGDIISVARDGTELPLAADADPALLWIGRKPFDLGASRPRAEGIFTRGGLRYRLILIGDRAFAEILP